MGHYIITALAAWVCFCTFLVIIAMSMAERIPSEVEEDERAFDPPELIPESPTIPKPIRKAMAVKDRLAKDQGLRERRARWAAIQEIDRLVNEVEEGR